MKITILSLGILTLSLFAEQPEETSTEKQAIIDKLVVAAQVEEGIKSGFNNMLPLIAQRAASLGLSDDKKAEFVEIYKSWFTNDIDLAAIVKKTGNLYAAEFSEDEMVQLTEFFSTDLGKKCLQKLPEINKKSTALGMQEGQTKQAQLMARVQPFLDVHTPKPASAPTSPTSPTATAPEKAAE